MDKKLACKLSAFLMLDLSYSNKPVDPVYECDDSPLKGVLDEIFSVDPVSGFPCGDIHYYMSTDANPLVKQWLENNIFKPRMVSSGSSVDGVTDDMLAEFSRFDGESLDDYQTRLMSIYDSAKVEYQKSLESKQE